MDKNIVVFENLKICSETETILNSIDLTISKGERIAITGESGSGKSTFSRALIGFVPKGLKCLSGNIKVDQMDVIKNGVVSDNLIKARRLISRLDQDPAASLTPTMTIKSLVTELSPFPEELALEKGKRALELFDLPSDDEMLSAYPSELSGGQRRRVALARTLSKEPKIIILDEPTVGLDYKTKQLVIELLQKLIDQSNATLILITHDLEVAKYLCEKVIAIDSGKVKTIDINQEIPINSNIKKNKRADKNSSILRVENLSIAPPSYKEPIIENFSLTLHKGEAIGIIGPSGSGKTTLAKTLLGLWPRLSGKVYIDDYLLPPLLEQWDKNSRGKIGWVPQDPSTSINPAIKLGTAFNRARKRNSNRQNHNGFSDMELMELMKLPLEWEQRYPKELSGGQLQRFAIARALVGGAKLIIMDEVTASLDNNMRDDICELFCEIKKTTPLLVITHDDKVVNAVCDSSIELDEWTGCFISR